MPEDSRAQRRRILNRRQSVRLATGATRRAISELPPSLRTKASGIGVRPILKQTTEFGALATAPNITFGVNREGRLLNRRTILGTARHEVAHRLGASPSVGAGHVAFLGAAGTQGSLTRQEVPQAVRLQKEPLGRRIQRAATQTVRNRPRTISSPRTRATPVSPAVVRSPAPTFSTPHLRKVEQTGTPVQQSRSRELQRRLGQRVRSRGVDF